MKFCSLLLSLALLHCISALEAEITHKVKLKDNAYTCLFKMRYEENTCLDTSKVFCSPKIKGKNKLVKDVKLILDDGTIIYIEKLKLSKRKKAKIIKCKVVSSIPTKTVEKKHLLSFPEKRNQSIRLSPSCGKKSVSCFQADVDIDILKYGNSIELPNNVTMVLTRRRDRQATFQSIEPEGEGIFSWNSEACISGHVNVDGHVWALKSCGANSQDCSDCYLWEELSNKWETEKCTISDQGTTRNQSTQIRTTQDTTTIKTYTVQIWYTPEFAALHSNNLAAINTYIDNLFAVTNQGYINSNIPVRAEVHCVTEHPTLHDIHDSGKMLNAFRDSMSKSELANSADAMALLVASSDACGRAQLDTTSYCSSYSVTEASCAADNYSFGHEIGHNFGASHNPENTTVNTSPYRYGHGHLIQPPGSKNGGYRTIMAYRQDHYRHRKNYYSSPDVTFPTTGHPTGTSTLSNNARVIMEQRFNMAACGKEDLLCPAAKSTTVCSDSLRIIAGGTNVHFLSGIWNYYSQYGGKPVYKFSVYYLFYHENRWIVEPEIGLHYSESGGYPLFGYIRFEGNTFCPENVGNRWKEVYSRELDPKISVIGNGSPPKCLSSPGYPGLYPDNSDTVQTISVPAGHSMEITFEDFDVEYGSSRCPWDYVEFFDGSGNSVGGRRCGNSLPAAFNIGTSTASVVFHSDSSVRKKGFKFCLRKAAQCTHTDKYPQWCPNWKKQGYCTHTHADWMATNCAMTCKC